MRGRVLRHPNSTSIPVKYGIEQFFVEQGSGIDIEKRRGDRQSLQIPMEIAVALSNRGVAVIKGYRWSKLGMQLEVTRLPQRDNTTNPLSEPRWHVIDPKGKTDEIGRLTAWERFRIVYRAPDASGLTGLTDSENVWLGYLPSRAFTAVGRID